MLNREQHAQLLAAILENPDTANVSEQVTQLAENYAGILSENKMNSEQLEAIKKQNDELVQQNLKLFLKIGQSDPPDNEPDIPEERPVLRFDDLVNDNGHIY